MKQATCILAFIAMGFFSFANSGKNNCISTPANDSVLVKLSAMEDMMKQVMNVIGSSENLELKEANVLNIEAKISHRKKYILYNAGFITNLNDATKDKWSVVALLAHEIGHHLNGHTMRRGGSKPELELEADEFAGFILQRLGATLQQSQNVMYFIAKKKGSKTHPSRDARLLAIEKGWNKAANAPATIVKN